MPGRLHGGDVTGPLWICVSEDSFTSTATAKMPFLTSDRGKSWKAGTTALAFHLKTMSEYSDWQIGFSYGPTDNEFMHRIRFSIELGGVIV